MEIDHKAGEYRATDHTVPCSFEHVHV